MNAIKLYLNEIVREMTRVWMPAFGIGSVMISAIVYGCVSDIFGILDFFLQIALGTIWTIAVYSVGILIRNEQEKKCWKANLYLVLGMILLGCYAALEYYIVFIIR
ncbi:MAG: hypothetical protein SO251_07580 [Candidatus Fimisoma sp.]|nr:hypothetical protein [Bacillota bacterium]MDY4748622.1 hypothetical protein [Candidatus Fimisoma sp.]